MKRFYNRNGSRWILTAAKMNITCNEYTVIQVNVCTKPNFKNCHRVINEFISIGNIASVCCPPPYSKLNKALSTKIEIKLKLEYYHYSFNIYIYNFFMKFKTSSSTNDNSPKKG